MLLKALKQPDQKTQHPISLLLPKLYKTMMWKYFQNSVCNFREKWEINRIFLLTLMFASFFDTINNITAWKLPVFGVFRMRIFLHSDWIRRDTPYLYIFSPNAGKHGQEKLRIRTIFTQCMSRIFHQLFSKSSRGSVEDFLFDGLNISRSIEIKHFLHFQS